MVDTTAGVFGNEIADKSCGRPINSPPALPARSKTNTPNLDTS
jgi:hypothetical protein